MWCATQGDVEGSAPVELPRSVETGVVLTLNAFMLQNIGQGGCLREAAYCRRGMKRLEQACGSVQVGQAEAEVGAEVYQFAGLLGVWPFRQEVDAMRIQNVGYVLAYPLLLVAVFLTPGLQRGVGVGLVVFHGSGQGHGVPLVAAAAEQYFGHGRNPGAGLWRVP